MTSQNYARNGSKGELTEFLTIPTNSTKSERISSSQRFVESFWEDSDDVFQMLYVEEDQLLGEFA